MEAIREVLKAWTDQAPDWQLWGILATSAVMKLVGLIVVGKAVCERCRKSLSREEHPAVAKVLAAMAGADRRRPERLQGNGLEVILSDGLGEIEKVSLDGIGDVLPMLEPHELARIRNAAILRLKQQEAAFKADAAARDRKAALDLEAERLRLRADLAAKLSGASVPAKAAAASCPCLPSCQCSSCQCPEGPCLGCASCAQPVASAKSAKGCK